jgi:hypothetical protein
MHHVKEYPKSEESQVPVYTTHWRDDNPEAAAISPKSSRHRIYRDETGNPSIKNSSLLSSMRYFPKNNKGFDDNNKNQSLSNKSISKSPQVIWEESYELKANKRNDERGHPKFSAKESASKISTKYLFNNSILSKYFIIIIIILYSELKVQNMSAKCMYSKHSKTSSKIKEYMPIIVLRKI